MKKRLILQLIMYSKYTCYALLLQIITMSVLCASSGNAQDVANVKEVNITIHFENENVIETLRKIEALTDFTFSYNKSDLKDVNLISGSYNGQSLYNILIDISRQTGIGFKQVNYLIGVTKITRKDNLETPKVEIIQAINVTGKVTSLANGEALPGVNVLVKGTSIGTVTDVDGNYSIEVPNEDDILVFSSVGFTAEEVPVNGRNVIDVALAEDIQSLSEVVVIGYGAVEKKDVTGAVASVSNEDFQDKPLNNLGDALVGRVSGLDVVPSGSNPGDVAQIRLRGNRSLVASNDPLIILDGMPFYGTINDVNPYDIVSIDVLKDASSTAIYGSQGANGVIVITTKRGSTGKARISVESFGGIVSAHGKIPVYNGEEFMERAREAARAAGAYPAEGIDTDLDPQILTSSIEYENFLAGNSTDYQEMLLQNGYTQKHQISVIGGSEAIKYNVSGNIFDEEGIIPTNKFTRYSLRTNLDFTVSPKFKVGTSVLMQQNVRSRELNPASYSEAVLQSPLGSPYEEDGTPRYDPNNDGYRVNPLSDLIWDSHRYSDKYRSVFANAFAEYDILPFLTYRLNLGVDVGAAVVGEFNGSRSLARRGDVSQAYVFDSIDTRGLYESILSFEKNIQDHTIRLTGIHSIQTLRSESDWTTVSGIPYESSLYHNIGTAEIINSVGSDLREENLLSYAGRVFYGFRDKYLFTATIRADGASQFAENNKWGYFPSASVAWRISEENLLTNVDWLTNLKLRLGYGISGNRGIAPYQSQGGLIRTAYSWGETDPAFGYRPAELVNRDLRWESTETYNLGLDFEFFEGRIAGNLELYNTYTYDLLMYRNIPNITGFDQVLQNVGSTQNRGVEVGLQSINIVKNNFRWNSNINFSLNREEIVELYNGTNDDLGNRWFIGQPINVYYDYKLAGIWQLGEEDEAETYNSEPGQIKLVDTGEEGITDSDRMIIGTQQPNFVFNILNTITWKNWDLSADTYVRWGHTTDVLGFQRESLNRLNSLRLDYWTPRNPINDQPRPDNSFMAYPFGSSLRYRDGSFIKLRQITVGYNFSESLLSAIKIPSARLYVTGQNLWYWTKAEGIKDFNLEPERIGSIVSRPATWSLLVGLNISF